MRALTPLALLSGGGAGAAAVKVGSASARPATGQIYVASDTPEISFYDPVAALWRNSFLPSPFPRPPPLASAATIVGTLGLQQRGDTLLAMSAFPTADAHAFWPLPGGITAAGPWTITLVGHFHNIPGSNFPVFGINLSTAAVASTVGLFAGCYWYTSDHLALGCWTVDLATQTRPSIFYNSNSFPVHTAPMYLRLLNDGTSMLAQYSNLFGVKWRTFFSGSIGSIYGATPTVYGVDNGCVSGSAFAESLVHRLDMLPLAQIAVSNVTLTPSVVYTVTTGAPHGLVTGDSVTLTGIVFTGTATVPPNAIYDSTVIVTGASSFTVSTGATGTFSYTSGGLVTNTSS
jgi:hypothetical protein